MKGVRRSDNLIHVMNKPIILAILFFDQDHLINFDEI